ncbi:MAG: hypothetical protein WBV39_15415 [Rudaea sp.]
MQQMYFFRPLRIAAMVMALGLLAACGGNRVTIKNGTTTATNVPQQFDVTLEAAKDGQFDLDGLTLSLEDLASHLRYLIETNNAAHTLLLKPGEKEGVKQAHIVALARVCGAAKLACYVRDDDGTLKLIQVVQ